MKINIRFQSKYIRVKHDYEARDDRWRIGMPAVFPLYYSKYCSLTEEWQWFWFRQLVYCYTNFYHWDENRLSKTELDILKGKWRSLTKSIEEFTNFKGTNENKDYITPNHLSGIAGQEPLICTGAIVKILGAAKRLSGEYKTPIETLDGTKSPPDISKVNRKKTPHLIFAATNNPADKSNPKDWKAIRLPDGRYRVDPFPQLQSFGKDTPVPLRTDGRETETYSKDNVHYAVNYIRTSRLISTNSDRAYVP
jgi:hypothetical protein